MNNETWQELHNDNGAEEGDKVTVIVDIEFGNNVIYECTGEVTLFRGLPCSAEVTKMKRFYLDDNGELVDDIIELALEDFPCYIRRAAEKKMVEDI